MPASNISFGSLKQVDAGALDNNRMSPRISVRVKDLGRISKMSAAE